MAFKLGRLPVKFHPKTLSFAKYLVGGGRRYTAVLPSPAEKVFREYKTPALAVSFAVKHGYSKMEAKKLFTGQVPE